MRRTRLKLRKTKVRSEIRWELTIPQKDGGRMRRYFTGKAEAETARDLAKIAQRNFGTAALSISDRLRIEATKAEETLTAYGKNNLRCGGLLRCAPRADVQKPDR
jgi:hypothetical protein